MKYKLTVFLVIILLLNGCTGYKGETQPEAEPPESPLVEENNIENLTFGIAYVSEDIMHPLITQNKLNLELYGLIYEGLFELDENFVAHPVLCDSYYNDGDTYYLTLRGGVLFSDGTALEADDVEYSFKLAMGDKSYYSTRLKIIKDVSAVDDLTVEIKLNAPNGRLPQILDFPIVKSQSEVESFPAGTGCFSVRQDGEGLHLFVRENWWRREVPPHSNIEMFSVDNVDELIYNFESLNIDIVTADSTGTDPIRLRGEYETRDYGTSVLQYIGFNMKEELFSNSLVRQAFSCLIDRESAAVQDFAGLAEPTLLPIHPRSPAYSSEYAVNIEYSVENAKSLLAAANIMDTDSDGKLDYGGRRHKPVMVSILVNQENKSKIAVCKRIADNLNRIGIAAEVREEKWDDYLKALKAGDFDIYYAEVNLCSDFTIDSIIEKSGNLNYGKFVSPDFEERIKRFRAVPLENDNMEIKSFYSEFALRVPFIPVLFKKNTVITHRNFFETLIPTEHNIYYGFYKWK